MTFRADLHCHSTCSDGSMTPRELVLHAKEMDLQGLSITDHDTIEAYKEAIPFAKQQGIELIPGIELSSMEQGMSVHILGYSFSLASPVIEHFCTQHSQRRKERNRAILEKLANNDMPIDEEEILGAASVGRPHIAQAMVKHGYVQNIQEAFNKYIGEGKRCYVKGNAFSATETIDTIHQAGGFAVIAHPHLVRDKKTIKNLLKLNFDGIECYYGNFPPSRHQKWIDIATNKGWMITGGSDFHGDIKPNIRLGCSWVGEDTFRILQSHEPNH